MQMALPASWEGYARSHLSHKTSTLLPWLITRDPSSPPLHNTLLMSHLVIAPWIIDLCVLHWGTLCQSFWPLQWPWHAPVPCHRVDEGVTSLASRVWSQKGSNSVGCHDTGIFVDCARGYSVSHTLWSYGWPANCCKGFWDHFLWFRTRHRGWLKNPPGTIELKKVCHRVGISSSEQPCLRPSPMQHG